MGLVTENALHVGLALPSVILATLLNNGLDIILRLLTKNLEIG